MTRAERMADRAQKLKDAREATTRQLAHVQAQQRELHRQALNKRRYHVGALADEAGLFTWSNADIAAVFAVLSRVAHVPQPAALLERLLVEAHDMGDPFSAAAILQRLEIMAR